MRDTPEIQKLKTEVIGLIIPGEEFAFGANAVEALRQLLQRMS